MLSQQIEAPLNLHLKNVFTSTGQLHVRQPLTNPTEHRPGQTISGHPFVTLNPFGQVHVRQPSRKPKEHSPGQTISVQFFECSFATNDNDK